MIPGAELAYLFRHALLREAAYQLQLPTERAALHGLAAGLLADIFGDSAGAAVCLEIADHARAAQGVEGQNPLLSVEARYLQLALQALGKFSDFRTGASVARRISRHPGCSAQQRFNACIRARENASSLSRWDICAEMLETAEGIANDAGDNAMRARALFERANNLFDTGKFAEAEAAYAEAVPLVREFGGAKLLGAVHKSVANCQTMLRKYDDGEAHYKQALELFQPGSVDHAIALAMYGLLLCDAQRLEESESTLNAALASFERLGNRYLHGYHHATLARVYSESGRYAEAEKALRLAAQRMREFGALAHYSSNLKSLATLLQRAGRNDEAEPLFITSIEILREVGKDYVTGAALNNLGVLYQNTARHEPAYACYAEALDLALRRGDSRSEGIARANIGSLLQDMGRLHAAEKQLGLAASAMEQGDAGPFAGVALGMRGALLLNCARLTEAEQDLERARQLIPQGAMNVYRATTTLTLAVRLAVARAVHFGGELSDAEDALRELEALTRDMQYSEESDVGVALRVCRLLVDDARRPGHPGGSLLGHLAEEWGALRRAATLDLLRHEQASFFGTLDRTSVALFEGETGEVPEWRDPEYNGAG